MTSLTDAGRMARGHTLNAQGTLDRGTTPSSTMNSKGVPTETSVRRRLHVLERAKSLSSLKKKGSDLPKILPLEMKHKSKDEQPPSSATDYDSQSESSEEDKEQSSDGTEEDAEEEHKNAAPPPRPTVHTRNLHRRSPLRDRSPMSPRSRAWYEFDLAVVVALVSPIGNWLTGGDHIKHLLLIALLIFYLHQIIESKFTIVSYLTSILNYLL